MIPSPRDLRRPERTPGAPSAAARIAAGAALAAGLLGSCTSPEAYAKSADDEVYAILEDRRVAMEADLGSIGLELVPDSLRARLLESAEAETVVLDLVAALQVAAENSREYQRRKQSLYLAALDLTLERWRFTVQEVGIVGAALGGTGSGDTDLNLDADLTLTKLLGTGARIIGDIGLNLFRMLSSGGSFDATSNIGLLVTQPLLAGYGERIVEEPLTQAERDVVYEVRSFERFRRTFGLDVVTRYLRLVQQVDTVANERSNITNLNELRLRNEALAAAGRLSDIQVDQARNDELSARDRLLQEEQRFSTLLDDFKLFLGLPPQSDIQIVPDALEKLAAAQPEELQFDDPERLATFALLWRLDHQTALDQVDDAERKAYVAADALRTVLDLVGEADWVTDPGQPFDFDTDDLTWTVGVDLGLALERLPQRNTYRTALISLQDAQLSAEESDDRIRVELRDDLREAERTIQTWELQKRQVALNERNVENTRLQLEAGRADTRDALDAQEALLLAQNGATRALIDQRLAVFALWLDLEILRLDESGLHPDPELLATLVAAQP